MCRAPAKLSIQSSLHWGQKRQEGSTPLEKIISLPFTIVTSERKDGFCFLLRLLFLPFLLHSMRHLFVTIFPKPFFGFRIIAALSPVLGRHHLSALFWMSALDCLQTAHASSSSRAIRVKMLSHLSRMIISYSTDMRIPLHLPPIPWWLFVWTGW